MSNDIVGRPLSSSESLRVFVALAVQPVVAGLLAFVTFPALAYTGRLLYGGGEFDSWDAATSMAAAAGLVGLVVTGLGALPLLAFLLSRGPISRVQVFTGGAILGNIPSAITLALLVVRQGLQGTTARGVSHLTYGPFGLLRAVAFGSFIGLGCAGAFWLIAGRHLGPTPKLAG